eukprot:3215037-Amphidinium_carterae.1
MSELPEDEAYYTDDAVAKLLPSCPTCKIVKDSFNACWRASFEAGFFATGGKTSRLDIFIFSERQLCD